MIDKKLLEESIQGIREFYEMYSPVYIWVPVSGGKDSVAVWGLVSHSRVPYNVIFIHIPGQTAKDNINSVYRVADALSVRDKRVVRIAKTSKIRNTIREALNECRQPCLIHAIVFTHKGEDYWSAMKRYGFPAPLGRFGKGTRWCCGVFKHRVLQRLPYNGEAPRGYKGSWKFGVNGIKATDSPYRKKKYTKPIISWPRTKDTYHFPILQYDDSNVWNILEKLRLVEYVKPQYDKWGRSPNCMFCPMLGKKLIEKTTCVLNESQKKILVDTFDTIIQKYKDTTFSYKRMIEWLNSLNNGIYCKKSVKT